MRGRSLAIDARTCSSAFDGDSFAKSAIGTVRKGWAASEVMPKLTKRSLSDQVCDCAALATGSTKGLSPQAEGLRSGQ